MESNPASLYIAQRKGVVETVPIDLALNVAVGSSVVLAARTTVAYEGILRSTTLWALLIFEAVVFVPVGAYLLDRYPEWSLMYLIDVASLPVPGWALALTYPVAALIGFVTARILLVRSGLIPVIALFAGAVLLAGAVTFFGQDQLLVVGTTEAFRGNGGALSPVFETPLAYILGAAGVGITSMWGWTLWRVHLMGQAAERSTELRAHTIVRDKNKKGGDTMQLEDAGEKPKKARRKTGKK